MEIKHGTNAGYTNGKCRCDECKAAHRAAAAKDRTENRERVNAGKRKRWAENPQAKETQRRWEEDNRERYLEYKRRDWSKHRTRRIEILKVNYQLHRQEYIDRSRRWKADNPARYREITNARRKERRLTDPVFRDAERERARISGARRRGVPFTPEAKEWIASLVDPRCTYCGGPAGAIDHIIPISKGGTGDVDNLTPACKSCNSEKYNLSLETFLRRKGLLDGQ